MENDMTKHATNHPSAIEGNFGRLATDARSYRPLDSATVTIEGRKSGDAECRIEVLDCERNKYFEQQIELVDNRGSVSFSVAGLLGAHYIYLYWPDKERHSRYLNFQVDCETAVETGDADFDNLYPSTRDSMRLGRREYHMPQGKMVGYISADTWHHDGVWLRDWIYGLPAYKFWEGDMLCGLNRFLEHQGESGMVPDGIERDGRTWRVGLESDVEYIFVLGIWESWQATGDDTWLQAAMPRLEQALHFIQSDPKHWDAERQLIKRQHSCDTWDFDFQGIPDDGKGRHVIATCDQSGYYLAFCAMGWMYRHLGQDEAAVRWSTYAEEYRRRAVELLWDGTKFQHHIHCQPIDHGDFDESEQLTMGNTWAMTRGLATREQAASIVDEYRRRHEVTGDAYPWWSLQPGYPDEISGFTEPFRKQNGYANGGLMPWVGGELCRAAFLSGREAYGVELLRAYAGHLRRTGGAQVWYWPDGEPGFRTTNEVNYAGWGMAEWLNALLEGLAGVRDTSSLLNRVEVTPRWLAAGVADARVTTRYAASNGYFAYRYRIDESNKSISVEYAGSGESAEFEVMLPEGWQSVSVSCTNALGDTANVDHEVVRADEGAAVTCTAKISGLGSCVIQC